MINQVILTIRAKKDLKKVPRHIYDKLSTWIKSVQRVGIENARKAPGYHDEPLRGKRQGQRSIRLSRSYRGIYVIKSDGSVKFVSLEEVTKHEY